MTFEICCRKCRASRRQKNRSTSLLVGFSGEREDLIKGLFKKGEGYRKKGKGQRAERVSVRK